MIDGTISFPTSVWNGLSDNADRKNRTTNARPNFQDWDQIVGEMIATQTYLATIRQHMTFGMISGNASAATDVSNWISVPNNMTLTQAVALAKTAPTGTGTLTVDVMRSTDGGATFATIWSTTANRPSIAASSHVATTSVFNMANLNAGDILRLDVISVGGTITGANVSVSLYGTPR